MMKSSSVTKTLLLVTTKPVKLVRSLMKMKLRSAVKIKAKNGTSTLNR